jgi:hypothetical protein
MQKPIKVPWTPPDQPLFDATLYGYGKDDSISDSFEKAAITHKEITLKSCYHRLGRLKRRDKVLWRSFFGAKTAEISEQKTAEKL